MKKISLWCLEILQSYWQKLTEGSTNRKIFGAALTVAFGTITVKLVSTLKELLIASSFGTSDDLDAFYIALLIPFFIVNIINSSFRAALIPTYIQVVETEGQEAGQRLFDGAVILGIGMLLLCTVLTVTTAPIYLPLIASGFDQEKLNLTVSILWAISPLLLLSGIEALWNSTLNSREKFSLTSLSPMATPIMTIVLLLATPDLGVFALVLGLIIGSIFQIFLLGRAMQKQGIYWWPKWHGFDNSLRQVLMQLAPMVSGSILLGSTALIDQSMASMLSPGSVAALNYGARVTALPNSLLHTALSTAIIPYYSKMVASKNWEGINHTIRRYLIASLAITIPIAIFLIVFSEPVIQMLFQRGSFTEQDTQLVAQIQAAFALQIPFYVGGILFVRIISSVIANHILLYGTVISLIINISCNYLFMKFIGVAGIALSTSIVYIISFIFLSLSWRRLSSKMVKSNIA